ncbi:P-loop containing nucleoside triphosphate hydrolase protein [Zopfochytrium polystomum]|nr:P-loop containing nucleoside triphosphate hydrolase protein [Zopfochytrium polystomum]
MQGERAGPDRLSGWSSYRDPATGIVFTRPRPTAASDSAPSGSASPTLRSSPSNQTSSHQNPQLYQPPKHLRGLATPPSHRVSSRSSMSALSDSHKYLPSPSTNLPNRPPSSASEPDPISEDYQYIHKYFSLFKMAPTYEYSELRSGTARGGTLFQTSVEVPHPSQSSFIIQAAGNSKKEARYNCAKKVKEIIDRDSLMDLARAAPARVRTSKRPMSMDHIDASKKSFAESQHRGSKLSSLANGSHNRNGLNPKSKDPDHVPDTWDSEPAKSLFSNPSDFRSRSSVISPSAQPAVDWWDEKPVQHSANVPPVMAHHVGQSVFERQPPQHWLGQQGYGEHDLDGQHYHNSTNLGNGLHNQTTYAPPQNRLPNQQEHAFGPYESNPKTLFPNLTSNMEEAIKKFITFYCARFKLPVPTPRPYQSHRLSGSTHFSRGGGRGRVKQIMGDWEVRLEIPGHTNADGEEIYGPIVAVGSGRNKKDAMPRSWESLCRILLSHSPPSLVEQFISYATPLKKRLADMLAMPLRVDISAAALSRLDSVLGDLRATNAFHIHKVHDQPNEKDIISTLSGGGYSGLGSGPRPPASFARPDDFLPPPAALDGGRDLPMYNYYAVIMAAIENNPVVILSAETGAGKTTQLPQFILSNGLVMRKREPSRRPARVIVTQPRRIAAISVAHRVAQERGEMIGKNSAIGYQVRFEDAKPKSDPEDGHVVFCTSGILLRRFQDDPTLADVTHVILDEVHERDLNTDLLLIITRQLLHRRPDIKIILMSATVETNLFAEYFRGYGYEGRGGNHPPIITVPGRLYPVKELYLEDVVRIAEEEMGRAGLRLQNDTQKFLRAELSGHILPTSPLQSASHGEEFPYDLVEAIIAHITATRPDGAILVFLPGWQEINSLQTRMKEEDQFRVGFGNRDRCVVYPLHSSVPTAGQQEVFEVPRRGIRKIILSTNIAETSVTINDIVYVIDSGKIRINSYDSNTRVSALNSVWAAQSNIKQRCGRAGRCQPGQYFSLLSSRRRQTLPYSMPPELLRVDLQATALKIKALKMSHSVASVLSQAPEPPPSHNVYQALRELRELGALDPAENLTPLGQVLSELPVDPWIGKMVLESAIFECLDPILTIAGAMEIGRGIYAIHPDDKQRARTHILVQFAGNSESDQLAMLSAFRAWKRSGCSREFAASNFLHGVSLLNIDRAKAQLLRVLEDGGFLSRRRVAMHGGYSPDELLGGPEANTTSNDLSMVRAILCGALFPNMAEVVAKDEYRSNTDYRLRLTGGSANSWRGLLVASGGDPLATQTANSNPGNGGGLHRSSSSSDFLDWVPDDPTDDLQPDVAGAPLPPRLLCYQEKQRVDGLVYMRSTTRADPLALLLFAPSSQTETGGSGDGTTHLQWTRLDGKPAAVLAGWIRIQLQDEQRARVIDEVRGWIEKYLDWTIWRRVVRKKLHDRSRDEDESFEEQERLGKMLVREVAGLIGSSSRGN